MPAADGPASGGQGYDAMPAANRPASGNQGGDAIPANRPTSGSQGGGAPYGGRRRSKMSFYYGQRRQGDFVELRPLFLAKSERGMDGAQSATRGSAMSEEGGAANHRDVRAIHRKTLRRAEPASIQLDGRAKLRQPAHQV